MKALITYALSKSADNIPFHTALQSLLRPSDIESQKHVGFIFSERLINMPVQVIPHMYRMLADEIKWAVDDVSLSPEHSTHHFMALSDALHTPA